MENLSHDPAIFTTYDDYISGVKTLLNDNSMTIHDKNLLVSATKKFKMDKKF